MQITRSVLTTACALAAISTAVMDAQPRTGRFSETFANSGITSSISYYVPEDYDSTVAYPLLYGWHGAGMPGSNMRDLLYIILAQRIKAIVVSPDANNCQTNDQLNNLINTSYSRAHQQYNIDTTRRVITGFSWGGRISFELGLLNPQLFNGIIGFNPAVGSLTQQMWNNIGRVRMATILGDQDFNFSAVDALMKLITTRGGSLLYLVKPGVVHSDNTYFNSQEFRDDYNRCYEYVLGITSADDVPSVAGLDIGIYPSPARGFCTITADAAIGSTMRLQVSDVRGNILYSAEIENKPGGIEKKIALDGWPAGIYYARVQANDRITNRAFVVLR